VRKNRGEEREAEIKRVTKERRKAWRTKLGTQTVELTLLPPVWSISV